MTCVIHRANVLHAVGLDPTSWRELFGAVVGASAALLGLFIVAISLHVRLVEAHPIVRNQARVSLVGLGLILVFSITVLVPGITGLWLAGELVGIVFIATFVYVRGLWIAHAERVRIPGSVWERMTLVATFDALLLGASVSLLLGKGPGLYLFVPALAVLLLLSVFMVWRLIFSPELHGPYDQTPVSSESSSTVGASASSDEAHSRTGFGRSRDQRATRPRA